MQIRRTFTINGREVEVTKIEYIYKDEKAVQNGILIHDADDNFHDGDCITGASMPDTAEELENILINEFLESCYEIDEKGIYHVE